jgi:putative SOS response-associated peptidase YedK
MCGRYSLSTDAAKLAQHFLLEALAGFEFLPRYNIAPTQAAPVVRQGAGGRRTWAPLRWGLIPPWAKDVAAGNRMINARGETLTQRPAFRAALRGRRCLVPADGFYEWQKQGARKQPMFISPRDGGLIAFAGLWERWQGTAAPTEREPLLAPEACGEESESGPRPERIESFCIITTGANELMRPIHERMPVIVSPADYACWLDAQSPAEAVSALVKPCPDSLLRAYAVSTRANDPHRDDPSCRQPLKPGPA